MDRRIRRMDRRIRRSRVALFSYMFALAEIEDKNQAAEGDEDGGTFWQCLDEEGRRLATGDFLA